MMGSSDDAEAVNALLHRPDRCAWRGNGAAWCADAVRLIYASQDPVALCTLAAAVEDVRLLRPAVACAVQLAPAVRQPRPDPYRRRPSTPQPDPLVCDDRRAGLWRDVQHCLLGSPVPASADTAYVGALAYFVRMRRSPTAEEVAALRARSPSGLLGCVLDPATWAPAGVAKAQESTRVRAVLLALAVDGSARPAAVAAAQRWVRAQPAEHATAALVRHAAEARTDTSGDDDDITPGATPDLRFDPFRSDALVFFPVAASDR